MLFRVFARLVAYSQLDRVEVELYGEFVHRAFKRHQPDRLARRAHGGRDRNVQRRETMPRQPIGSGIEGAGLESGALIGLLARQVAGKHIMADRKNAPIAVSARRSRWI